MRSNQEIVESLIAAAGCCFATAARSNQEIVESDASKPVHVVIDGTEKQSRDSRKTRLFGFGFSSLIAC